MSRERHSLCPLGNHEPIFSPEEALPAPRRVQRVARLCTQSGRESFAITYIKCCRSSGFCRRHFRRPLSLWPNSTAESELPVPI
jgi:hypothetical protein